jgi:hypothetical protein
MARFGKKQDPDQQKLSRRTSEIQEQIDALFESLKNSTKSQGPSFKLIMAMTTEANAEVLRFIALRESGGLM